MRLTTLIDAATLEAHLGEADWRIVDVRHQLSDAGYGIAAWRAGHIPGAVFLHCDHDLSGPQTGDNGRHPLPDPATFVARLAAAGISPQTQVVVYDDTQGMIAGRLWWMLRSLGYPAVAVLDGGWQAWLAAGGAQESGEPAVAAASAAPPVVTPAAFADFTVDTAAVIANLATPAFSVIDARAPDRFRGENETLDPRAGHIPGARNRCFRDNLTAEGFFKPAEDLRQAWLAVMAGQPASAIVHQCGSGVSACHNLLAMEIAGLPGSRLYPGSWSAWCADPARPAVLGDRP